MNTSYEIYATGNAGRPLNIVAKSGDNVAQISIIGQIANWSDANSGTVRSDILVLGKKHKTAHVYINSEGGSCIEANEIVNILEENFDNVLVIGGAIVASAASFILCSFPNQLSKNSQVMIHEPQGYYSGTHKSITKQLKLLKSLEDDYVAIYATKTGKTSEEITALWNDGDHWMNAQEALTEGFADEIVGAVPITQEDALAITAMGAPYEVAATVTPQNLNPNSKNMNQEVLALQLGLPKDATEAQIAEKVTALQTVESENAALKLNAVNAVKAQKDADIKAMLDTAEQEKKITPDLRAHYEMMAQANLDSVKAILAHATAVQPISGQLAPGATSGTTPTAFPYETYKECLEANDAAAFDAYQENEPTKAQALLDVYYAN